MGAGILTIEIRRGRSDHAHQVIRTEQPRPVTAEPTPPAKPVRRRATEPGPRRPTAPRPRRHQKPGQPRSTRSQQPRNQRSQQPRSTRSQRPRYIRSEPRRQSGTGQPQVRNQTELEALNVLTRSGICSPRRGKSVHGNSWLPRCKCSEPAHAMCHIAHLARGNCVPLRSPTAARLSPACGRAGRVAPAPSFRSADA